MAFYNAQQGTFVYIYLLIYYTIQAPPIHRCTHTIVDKNSSRFKRSKLLVLYALFLKILLTRCHDTVRGGNYRSSHFFFTQYRFDRSACSPAVTFTSDSSQQYDLTIGGDISTGSRRPVKEKKLSSCVILYLLTHMTVCIVLRVHGMCV